MQGTIGKNMPNPLDVALASKVVALNERPGLFKGVASDMVGGVKGENTILFTDIFGKPYTARDVLNIGIRSGAFKTEQQVLFNSQNFEDVVKMTEKMDLPPDVLKNVLASVKGKWWESTKEAANNLTDFANATDNTYRLL